MTGWRAQVVKFAVVGVVGFCVDAGVLYVLVRLGWNAYAARLFSFPLAVTATWYLNAHWTFDESSRSRSRGAQYARYVGVQTVGALTNYACYAVVLRYLPASAEGAVVALAIGSAAGLVVNFVGARLLVFRSGHDGTDA